jgi:hypothetical protein
VPPDAAVQCECSGELLEFVSRRGVVVVRHGVEQDVGDAYLVPGVRSAAQSASERPTTTAPLFP